MYSFKFKRSVFNGDKKRIAAGTLAAAMAALTLTSCGSDSSSSGSTNTDSKPADLSGASNDSESLEDIIPEETVTLDVYSQVANYSGEQIGWFAKVMKDKFNVKLNIIDSPEGTFETRMEGDSLGDILVFGNEGDFAKAAKAGKLLDWEDENFIDDYGAEIKKNFTYALEKNKNITGSDGKLHGFGYDVGSSANNRAQFFYYPCVRYDLYKEIGSPEIKTLEDYVSVFEEMKKKCPKSDTGKETYAVFR